MGATADRFTGSDGLDEGKAVTAFPSSSEGLPARWLGRLGAPAFPDGDGPTVVDLFAGCGGLSLGFASAGYRVTFAAEKDSLAAATYTKNFPDATLLSPSDEQPNSGDVSKLKCACMMPEPGSKQEKVGLVVGGPPCQGFSYMGHRRSDDPRNQLYQHFVRLVGELQPDGYLFENVPGMRTMDEGEVFDDLISSLEGIGYSATPLVLNAAAFGVPQLRKRLFVVGARHHHEVQLNAGPLTPEHFVTVQDAIYDLPFDLSDDYPNESYVLPYRTSATSEFAKLMRDGSMFARNCVPTRHSAGLLSRIEKLGPGEVDPASRHRRLAWDRPAPTLRAASRTRTSCRPIHPSEARVITPREAARLSSFPDEFWLPDTIAPAHMLLGNSVPPLLAHHLARSLANSVPFSVTAADTDPDVVAS